MKKSCIFLVLFNALLSETLCLNFRRVQPVLPYNPSGHYSEFPKSEVKMGVEAKKDHFQWSKWKPECES